MTDFVRLSRVLWGVIAVCLLGGAIAVPIVDDDGDRVEADGQWVGSIGESSTTSAAEPPACAANGGCAGGDAPADPGAAATADSSAAAVPAPGPAVMAPGAGGGTAGQPGAAPPPTAAPPPPPTTAAPTEDLGPPSDPGPAKPPRVGTYRYKLTAGSETRDTTTTIEDRGTSGAETRQLVRMRGEGFDIDSDVAWRSDGVHVLSSVIMFGTSKGSCDWEPDTLQLRLPAAKGTTWESTSTCSMTGIGPTPIPVSRKITGRFVELRRVRVAGQVVDVWAIEGTERIEAAGRATDRSGTTMFSPKHGFAVSSSGTITTADGTTDYRNEIQNLDPE